MQAELDRRIKEAGAENAYFPLFIPESFLQARGRARRGVRPRAGGRHPRRRQGARGAARGPADQRDGDQHFFAKWVQSHRDLPLLINQWANVVRWELRPRLFLRTTEFLWQEGHTAHATEDDARAYALRILDDVYRATMVDVLRHPRADRPQDGAGALRRRHPHLDLRGDDGRRQGAADGHEPRARAELRPRLRHHVLQRVGRARVRVADVVGRLHPAHRGAGHGPRRRLRPAAAAGAGAGAGGGARGQGRRPRCGAAAEALVAELRAAGPPGPPRRPHRHRLRPPQRGLGAQGRARCGSRWGPATWPRATSPWSRGTAGRRRTSPLAGGGRRRWPAVLAAGRGATSWPRRRRARDARTADVASLDEAVEAGSSPASPGCRWARSGPTARTGWPQHAITRALPAAARRVAGRARRRRGRSRGRRRPVVLRPRIAIIHRAVHFQISTSLKRGLRPTLSLCGGRGHERTARGGDGDEQG